MKIRASSFCAALACFSMVFGFQISRAASLNRHQIGVQLYSLRNQFARDVPGTMFELRAMGVVNVELAGTYGLTPEQFRSQLDAHGLAGVSGHFSYERFRDDAEGIAKESKILGLKYAGCPWIPHDEKSGFDEKTCREAAAMFNRAGAVLAKHGLKFFYHTHGYEFQPYENGTLFYLLMRETDPRFVNFEMDVFWVKHSGQDPVPLLEKYGHRWQLLHLKGMRDTTPTGFLSGHSSQTNDVAVGTGKIDYVPVLNAARKIGVRWFLIEDESPSSEQQLPRSMAYLQTVHWSKLGIFARQSDIGDSDKKGSSNYNPKSGSYVVAGGCANIGSANDAFHFVWTKISGDFTLTADVRWQSEDGNPHRKACLMLRQALAPDSPYADVVLHGNGLAALQFRETKGGTMNEIQSDMAGPGRLRIERRGDDISMYLAHAAAALQPAGNLRLPIHRPVYAGLAVCAHDNQIAEQAVFSNVQLIPLPSGPNQSIDP